MTKKITRYSLFLALGWLTFAGSNMAFAAQRQVTVPGGTVIELRLETGLDSESSQVRDTFKALVTQSVLIDGQNVIPEQSVVEGQVTAVKPASRGSDAGVIGVEFTKLTIAGKVYAIKGALTSLRADERKQIIDEESRVTGPSSTTRNVVFIGGGAGVGAVVGAIAGGGKGAGIGALTGGGLGALGALFSRGAEAKVPAGSTIAMQLIQPITLTGRAQTQRTGTNDRTLYTSANMVRDGQTALTTRKYYSGVVNGRLDDSTRRAIAHFQIDNNLPATGDLDDATAKALGLGNTTSTATDKQRATDISRKATALLRSYETRLGVRANNIQSTQQLSRPDLELLLQLNGFSEAAAWYDQSSRDRNLGTFNNIGGILVQSAKRVEQAMVEAAKDTTFQTAWSSIQSDTRQIAYDIVGGR